MTVRRRTWTTASGQHREAFLIDIQITAPDGRVHRLRRNAPVQNLRAADNLERRLRADLLVDLGLTAAHDASDPTLPAASSAAPTLADFAPAFLEHHRAKGNKPGELAAKRQILDQHLLPAFGHLPLDQLTTRRIDEYKAQKQRAPEPLPDPKRPRPDRPRRTERGRAPLSPHTVNNHLTVLRALLNLAARWDLIPRRPHFEMVKEDQRDPEYLTPDEARRLLAAAAPDWRTFFLFALGTGLRVGELRALHWTDLDLDRRHLRVARSLTRTGYSSPKSRRPRTVHLAHDLLHALRAHPRHATSPLVFPRQGGAPLTLAQIRHALDRTARAADISRPLRPGILRHTFATHGAMEAIPLPVLQSWMGHSDIRVTMRYAHVAPSESAPLADRLATRRS